MHCSESPIHMILRRSHYVQTQCLHYCIMQHIGITTIVKSIFLHLLSLRRVEYIRTREFTLPKHCLVKIIHIHGHNAILLLGNIETRLAAAIAPPIAPAIAPLMDL